MLERVKEATRSGKYTYIEYARFADDVVILIDAHPRQVWLLPAVEKRLREELAALQVEINEEKSRRVDLSHSESFGFLGFDFRRVRSRRGYWRAKLHAKAQEAHCATTETQGGDPPPPIATSRSSDRTDQPGATRLGELLRGWKPSECFSFIQDWIEKKIRRHMMRARKQKGFGWTRWSRQWLYETLKLFNGYQVGHVR